MLVFWKQSTNYASLMWAPAHAGIDPHELVVRTRSPAHAGIDPARIPRSRRSSWFPRTRGDRPWLVTDALQMAFAGESDGFPRTDAGIDQY